MMQDFDEILLADRAFDKKNTSSFISIIIRIEVFAVHLSEVCALCSTECPSSFMVL